MLSAPTPVLDHVRPRFIEIVWNSYVLQLWVVNYFARDCYNAPCLCPTATTSISLTIFRVGALIGCEDSRLFYPQQIAYNEDLMCLGPNGGTQFKHLATFLLFTQEESNPPSTK
jgi:hypothetical protein